MNITETIATIIFFGSAAGMAMIILWKIPVLNKIPEAIEKTSKDNLWMKSKAAIKNLPFLNSSFEIFLQKVLSKIRVLTLRIENKTAGYLQSLREKAHQKKSSENDSYWQELKKPKNQ